MGSQIRPNFPLLLIVALNHSSWDFSCQLFFLREDCSSRPWRIITAHVKVTQQVCPDCVSSLQTARLWNTSYVKHVVSMKAFTVSNECRDSEAKSCGPYLLKDAQNIKIHVAKHSKENIYLCTVYVERTFSQFLLGQHLTQFRSSHSDLVVMIS